LNGDTTIRMRTFYW